MNEQVIRWFAHLMSTKKVGTLAVVLEIDFVTKSVYVDNVYPIALALGQKTILARTNDDYQRVDTLLHDFRISSWYNLEDYKKHREEFIKNGGRED